MASSYPDSAHTQLIHKVCDILGKVWNLRVLCECQSTHAHCQATCHTLCATAMGFCMVQGAHGTGMAYPHPNALSVSWDLKWGAPVKSTVSQHAGYVTAIFSGALVTSVPWCKYMGCTNP